MYRAASRTVPPSASNLAQLRPLAVVNRSHGALAQLLLWLGCLSDLLEARATQRTRASCVPLLSDGYRPAVSTFAQSMRSIDNICARSSREAKTWKSPSSASRHFCLARKRTAIAFVNRPRKVALLSGFDICQFVSTQDRTPIR
jgi:hypothetical protein